MQESILIVGAAGHARVVADIVEKEGRYRIAGFIDRSLPAGDRFLDYRILGAEKEIPDLAARYGVCGGIIAVGDNWTRFQIAQRIRAVLPHFRFMCAVHPSAEIGLGAALGAGTVVMARAIVNPRCRVGELCIINTKASLGHDCLLADFACLLPDATVGGNVTIGRLSVVALGANVIQGIHIGEQSVIGAGSTVVRDIPPFVVAYGSPARIVRQRNAGDPYLAKREHTTQGRA
jgi:sugar O-acyltransferase (sialic acid O-acetyltransferase NeuD family)